MNPFQGRPAVIETTRLSLMVLLPSEIEALIDGDTERAGQLVGARFPAVWPKHMEAKEGLPWHLQYLRADAAQQEWRIRVMVERESGVVVGSINLKGPPDAHGDVEIGWGVNEDRRRRGYAFEATTAVLEWAASPPCVGSRCSRITRKWSRRAQQSV
jgi:RimJ/RimL family protein N-acetyltransferase